MTTQQDRFHRQQDLVPRDRLAAIKATVIGVGAIGRQVACNWPPSACPDPNRRLRRGGPHQRHHPGLPGQRRGAAQGPGHVRAISGLDPAITVECIEDRYRPETGDRPGSLLLRRFH